MIISAAVLLLVPFFLWATIKLISWYLDIVKTFPLNDSCRRQAGHFIRMQLESKERSLFIWALMLPMVPVLLALCLLLLKHNSSIKLIDLSEAAYFYFPLLLIHAYWVYRKMVHVGRLKLALEAEIMVAGQLNQLMEQGYRIYHEVRINGYTIDHMVLGEAGLFIVRVAVHPKPLKNGHKQFRIRYENDTLIFPNGKNKKDIVLAQRQSGWAMAWLTKATGIAIKARPVLLVPGWYIEPKDRPPLPILTTKQIETYFSRKSTQQFSIIQLDKISEHIEHKYRN